MNRQLFVVDCNNDLTGEPKRLIHLASSASAL
jgi:hypothetical protein